MTDRQIDIRIKKIEAIKTQVAELEEARKALEEEVKTVLGDAETYETRNWKVTWTKYIAPVFHKEWIPKEMVDSATTFTVRRRFGFAKM